MRRLHPFTILLNFLQVVRSMVFPIVIILISGRTRDNVAELVLSALGLIGVVVAIIRYQSTRFEIANGKFELRTGVLVKQVTTIPLERIQNVVVKRSIVQKVLGIATLHIETAAGDDSHGNLDSVAEKDVDELCHQLMQKNAAPAAEVQRIESSPALYTVPISDLIIAGALENRMIYIIAILVGTLTQGSGANRDNALVNTIRSLHGLGSPVLVFTGFFLLGLLVGWIYSIGFNVLKYYNFSVRRHANGLRVAHGLINHFETVIPVRRAQGLTVTRSLPFRWAKLAQMRVRIASGSKIDQEESTGSVALAPLVKEQFVQHLTSTIFPERLDARIWLSPSPKALLRWTISSVFTYLIIAGVPLLVIDLARFTTSGKHISIEPKVWILVSIGLVALSILGAILRLRTTRYAFENGFLRSKMGFWKQTQELVPVDRVQHWTLDQSFFQRRAGLADVSLSLFQGSMSFPMLDLADAEALVCRISEGARTMRADRKGGL